MKKAVIVFLTLLSISVSSCAQDAGLVNRVAERDSLKTSKMMKIEIWSDVMCPFCYIGKRKFEKALSEFEGKDQVVVEWKSFQLNPNLVTDPSKNTIQHLAESKGWTMDYTMSTIDYVKNMAKEVGLNYDFEKAVVANSFDAHRLIQFAKSKGKGDLAEEQLFKAYFVEGKNTADHQVLLSIAAEIGLDANEAKGVLESDQFAAQVRQDVAESEKLGISGVPFFVVNRQYGISGAQDSQVFLDTLNKAWAQLQH